jgi:hypothetical protein
VPGAYVIVNLVGKIEVARATYLADVENVKGYVNVRAPRLEEPPAALSQRHFYSSTECARIKKGHALHSITRSLAQSYITIKRTRQFTNPFTFSPPREEFRP